MTADARRRAVVLALGCAGALSLGLPAAYYRPDRVACSAWPPLATNLLLSLVHLAAVALLTTCWIVWTRRPPARTRIVFLAAAILHGCALVAPPYLSHDPLFYAAIGRVMAAGDSPYVALDRSLPLGSEFLIHMGASWRGGTSAYFPGWNEIAHAVGLVAGDRLIVHLRLHQLVGMGAILSAAAIATRAAKIHFPNDPGAAPRAAALCALCPLAVIEATQAAHNDALLAVAMAGFALAMVTRRRAVAALALAAGIAVKASAILPLGIHALQRLGELVAPTRRRAILLGLGLILLGAIAAPIAAAELHHYTLLIGTPNDPDQHCTRAIECLPRNVLRYALDRPLASWVVGLCARAIGALWLLASALATRAPGRQLAGVCTSLFIYYLYLHGWFQSWYLLPLVPLMPFVDEKIRPALAAACVSAVAYYAIKLPADCEAVGHGAQVAGAALETVTVLAPSTFLLWRSRAWR